MAVFFIFVSCKSSCPFKLISLRFKVPGHRKVEKGKVDLHLGLFS